MKRKKNKRYGKWMKAIDDATPKKTQEKDGVVETLLYTALFHKMPDGRKIFVKDTTHELN